jgi:hypothetical protein
MINLLRRLIGPSFQVKEEIRRLEDECNLLEGKNVGLISEIDHLRMSHELTTYRLMEELSGKTLDPTLKNDVYLSRKTVAEQNLYCMLSVRQHAVLMGMLKEEGSVKEQLEKAKKRIKDLEDILGGSEDG